MLLCKHGAKNARVSGNSVERFPAFPGGTFEPAVQLARPSLEAAQVFKFARWISRIVSIGFVFRPMNFVAKDVRDNQLLDQTWLKQILEAMCRGDLLRLPDVIHDHRDVTHCTRVAEHGGSVERALHSDMDLENLANNS